MSFNRVLSTPSFFLLLLGVGYFVASIITFVGALTLSVIIVTICYPLYERLLKVVYKKSESLAAAFSYFDSSSAQILPILFISAIFVKELVGLYQTLGLVKRLSLKVTSLILNL